MVLVVVKAQVEIPPVVKQRDEVCHEPTWGKFARGVAAVATAEGGPLMAGDFFESLPKSGQAFGGGVFIAGAHFYAEADAQICHEITVIDVAGASGLLWVVADFRSLLASVKGLYGDVDVEDPGQS